MTNTLGMVLIRVPGGRFWMGHYRYPAAAPVHEVEVDGFWIGQCEVTYGEFDRFRNRARTPEAPTARHPVTRVTWEDAREFCAWLSQREGRRYRLPTEAEWEYAARGGLEQKDYPWGNEPPRGRAAAGQRTTSPVGSFAPNGFGLHDMAGNVGEWVSDWDHEWREFPPPDTPRRNPTGPAIGDLKIYRGGLYATTEVYCYRRSLSPPGLANAGNGFRVVLDLREKDTKAGADTDAKTSKPEKKPGRK